MTTKEMERKALDKIRKIIEELGEDSYIGMAFDGCLDHAKFNIENDWGCSWHQTAEALDKELTEAKQEAENWKSELNDAYKELEKERVEKERYKRWYEKDAETIKAKNEQIAEAADHATENWCKFREQEDRADALEQEVIRLKAKLYDLMVAE